MKNNAVAIAVRWADAYKQRTGRRVEVIPGEQVSIECPDASLRISVLTSHRYEIMQGRVTWKGSLEEALCWAQSGNPLV